MDVSLEEYEETLQYTYEELKNIGIEQLRDYVSDFNQVNIYLDLMN